MRKILIMFVAILGIAMTSCKKEAIEQPVIWGEQYVDEQYGMEEDSIMISQFKIVGVHTFNDNNMWKLQLLDNAHQGVNRFVVINNIHNDIFKLYKLNYTISGSLILSNKD